MDIRIPAAVQRLPALAANAESRPEQIGPISLEEKQTGERSARKSDAAFAPPGAKERSAKRERKPPTYPFAGI